MAKTFNIVIFSDTINMINVKVSFTHSYHLPKICSHLIKFKLCMIIDYNFHQVDHEYATIFDCCTFSREMIDIFPCLKEKGENVLNIGFFSDTYIRQDLSNCA